MLAAAPALAGVTVADEVGCLDAEAVDLEVRSWVGDDTIDRSTLEVGLTPRGQAWELLLAARTNLLDGEESFLWGLRTEVQPVDCPLLPRLIGRIAEQQYAGIPAWRLDGGVDLPIEMLAEVAGTAPDALHFAFGAGLGVPLADTRWRWFVHTEAYLAGPLPIGTVQPGRVPGTANEPRTAQFAGVLFGTGIGLDVPLGSFGIRGRGLVSVGPHVAYGRDFTGRNGNDQNWRPRATSSLQLDLLTPIPLRVGARVTTPFVRLAPAQDLDPGTANPEPWVRVGLVVGVGAPLPGGSSRSE